MSDIAVKKGQSDLEFRVLKAAEAGTLVLRMKCRLLWHKIKQSLFLEARCAVLHLKSQGLRGRDRKVAMNSRPIWDDLKILRVRVHLLQKVLWRQPDSLHVLQTGLELDIFLPPPPKCWTKGVHHTDLCAFEIIFHHAA